MDGRKMDGRKNVLLVMADQLTATALRAYGNGVCKTPNIDALAARGTVFENCYSNFPLCSPSRASLLTGRLASRLGVYDNACEFPAQAPTIPYYLSALGYATCLSGKMHFVGPEQLHGYQERLTTDIYPSDFGWTPDWQQAIPVAATGVSLRSVVEAGTCKRSLQLDYDDEVVFKAEQKIRDHGRKARGQPLFLTVSFTHPHNPYVISEEYWNLYDHAAIDMPRVGPLARAQLDPHSQRLHDIYKFGQYDITPEDVRSSRHAYYAAISYVDRQLGRLLAALDEMDMRDDTVVVFTSDHGDMLGERGLWYKWTLLEGATRIPLIIAAPGQGAARIGEPVSLLDLLPTLVDIGSDAEHAVEAVSEREGTSLMPAVQGSAALDAGRPVFAEMAADGAFSPCLMVRRGAWKYIHCADDPPQLFNLVQDPDELHNRAGEAGHRTTEAELLALVNSNWSPEELKAQVEHSARQRLFIQRTRLASHFPAWDYEPRRDASRQFVRNGASSSATAVKGLARYPFVAPKPPDHPDHPGHSDH
ncbi:MAG: choline-sulfatase [Pseudomonadota bacterium]